MASPNRYARGPRYGGRARAYALLVPSISPIAIRMTWTALPITPGGALVAFGADRPQSSSFLLLS